GKRLGVQGVKSRLGFKMVYNGEDFKNYLVPLNQLHIIYGTLPDTTEMEDEGSLASLVSAFVIKAGIKPENKDLDLDLIRLGRYGNDKNIDLLMNLIKPHLNDPDYKNNPMIQLFVSKPDTVSLRTIRQQYDSIQDGVIPFSRFTHKLRGVKTPAEL